MDLPKKNSGLTIEKLIISEHRCEFCGGRLKRSKQIVANDADCSKCQASFEIKSVEACRKLFRKPGQFTPILGGDWSAYQREWESKLKAPNLLVHPQDTEIVLWVPSNAVYCWSTRIKRPMTLIANQNRYYTGMTYDLTNVPTSVSRVTRLGENPLDNGIINSIFFDVSGKPKDTWKQRVLLAVESVVAFQGSTKFSRKDLLAAIKPLLPSNLGEVSKTPDQTVSRTLQELRDMGILSFEGNGQYELMYSPRLEAINSIIP